MKTLTEFLNEGIISEDNTTNVNKITEWIDKNYDAVRGLKISNTPNRRGLYEVDASGVDLHNKNITSLTNGMFVWNKVGYFNCKWCHSLKSLEGGPIEVDDFSCCHCTSLQSLQGAPKKVKGDFECSGCDSLKTLEGGPIGTIGRNYDCSNCSSLKSLQGAPSKVEGDFDCSECGSLVYLTGIPKYVGGDFSCYGSKKEFEEYYITQVERVKVEGSIYSMLY